MTDQTAENPVSGQVLLYSRPEPLDARRHGHLGVRQTNTPYGFAAKQHFVPLNVGEFGPASVSYPIVFAGDSHTPLAIMGVRPGENLFIEPNGAYKVSHYIPAYLRRYPFVGAVDSAQGRVVVCIDAASDLVTDQNPDARLFENGEITEYVRACMNFCSQYDTDRALTDSFVALLRQHDLFEIKQLSFTPRNPDGSNGQPVPISEYYSISEEKLMKLPADVLVQLRNSGALSQIYAHLHSLYLWERVVGESMLRQAAETGGATVQ